MSKLEIRQLKTTADLCRWVRTELGHPVVKVELTDEQIINNIISSLNLFLKYASGQSTEDAYYTLMLKGGQAEYELNDGILDIISFDDSGLGDGGINTLFTLQNQIFNAGMLDFRNLTSGLTLLSYHMALDFIEVIRRYTTSGFQWTFDEYDKILTLNPVPEHENNWRYNPDTGKQELIDSPGYILLHVKQLIGAGKDNFDPEKAYFKIFNQEWLKWYTLALCKITLGMIRRKFSNFSSIGNTGIQLDGDSLVSEGKEEKERLEDQLQTREQWEGFGIITGVTT